MNYEDLVSLRATYPTTIFPNQMNAGQGQVFASMDGYLVPAVGCLMSVFLLGEKFHWNQMLGLLVIFIGMYFVGKRVKEKV